MFEPQNANSSISTTPQINEGKKFLDEFPTTDIAFTMNTRCEHESCQGNLFKTNTSQHIVCLSCGAHQRITEQRGAYFWATRVWRPLSHHVAQTDRKAS